MVTTLNVTHAWSTDFCLVTYSLLTKDMFSDAWRVLVFIRLPVVTVQGGWVGGTIRPYGSDDMVTIYSVAEDSSLLPI